MPYLAYEMPPLPDLSVETDTLWGAMLAESVLTHTYAL
jgi:hypothetical protein